MYELKVKVNEILTPKACSKLVIQLIKYILYNTNQLPCNYEILSTYFSERRSLQCVNEESVIALEGTYKEIMFDNFHRKILQLYVKLENTFKSIESEFIGSAGIKEIILMIGSTFISPSKIYRIQIPVLPNKDCETNHSVKKSLGCLCSYVFNSEELHDYFKGRINPTNIYILLKMKSGFTPKSGWFHPKEGFVIPSRVKHMRISFEQPETLNCGCLELKEVSLEKQDVINNFYAEEKKNNMTKVFNVGNLLNKNDIISWYQPKENLQGFKDQQINGVSALNYMLSGNKIEMVVHF